MEMKTYRTPNVAKIEKKNLLKISHILVALGF